MAARRRRTPVGPEPRGHLVRTDEWAGLRPGDPVDVAGTRLRSATWAYVAHVRNAQTGDEWVEVVGGRPGEHALRSFRPEQVYPPGTGAGRRAGSASLADAPRLPLR